MRTREGREEEESEKEGRREGKVRTREGREEEESEKEGRREGKVRKGEGREEEEEKGGMKEWRVGTSQFVLVIS